MSEQYRKAYFVEGGPRGLEKIYVTGYGSVDSGHGRGYRGILCLFFALLFFLILLGGMFAALVEMFPPQGTLILEYHKVNDRTKDNYTVTPEEFAAQMDALKEDGYTTISVLDFLRAKKGKQQLPEKPVVVTFDDGYSDNYTEALPILEKRGMKATVFMVTNDIGLPGYLTWDQLHDMEKRGVELGSHTANHLPLTNMTVDEARDEVQKSKLIMEWNGLKTVFVLSYPNGKYDKFLPGILKEEEYLAAVTGDAGLNTFQTDPYRLMRTNVPPSHFGVREFRLRIWKAKLFALLGLWQNTGSIEK